MDEHRLEELFHAFQRGDETAFREFHSVIARPILAYAFAFTKDTETAKDVLQTSMASIIDHKHRYKRGNLLGWVFTIVRNAGRRHEITNQRYVTIDETAHLASAHERPRLDHDELESVRSTVMKLDEEYRTCILLFYFAGFTIQEIANAESISPSLVKVRMHRARTLLKSQLLWTVGVHE